jgi:hypothetical protein
LRIFHGLATNKTDLKEVSFNDLVERLEKSSPLIFEEIERWRYLLWDDWVEYQREERRKRFVVP